MIPAYAGHGKIMKKIILSAICTITFASATFAESIATMKIPQHSATIPKQVMKKGKADSWWIGTHKKIITTKETMEKIDVLFVGDSITHGWTLATFPKNRFPDKKEKVKKGKNIWDKYYKNRNILNAGISGDKTQNVLWRLQNGTLKGISPKVATLTIGHNNGENTVEELSDGMLALLREIRKQCPKTKILFIPHFPTLNPNWKDSKTIKAYNIVVEKVKNDKYIIPTDLNPAFLNEDGVLKDINLIPDQVHPGESGYQLWYETMEPILLKLLKSNE